MLVIECIHNLKKIYVPQTLHMHLQLETEIELLSTINLYRLFEYLRACMNTFLAVPKFEKFITENNIQSHTLSHRHVRAMCNAENGITQS